MLIPLSHTPTETSFFNVTKIIQLPISMDISLSLHLSWFLSDITRQLLKVNFLKHSVIPDTPDSCFLFFFYPRLLFLSFAIHLISPISTSTLTFYVGVSQLSFWSSILFFFYILSMDDIIQPLDIKYNQILMIFLFCAAIHQAPYLYIQLSIWWMTHSYQVKNVLNLQNLFLIQWASSQSMPSPSLQSEQARELRVLLFSHYLSSKPLVISIRLLKSISKIYLKPMNFSLLISLATILVQAIVSHLDNWYA